MDKAPVVEFDGGYIQVVNPKYPIKGVWSDILFLEKGMEFPPHKHDFTSSLLICMEGSGELTIDKRIFKLKKNTAIFIPSRSDHSIRASKNTNLKCLSINEGIININSKNQKKVDIEFSSDRTPPDKWEIFFDNCQALAKRFSKNLEKMAVKKFKL